MRSSPMPTRSAGYSRWTRIEAGAQFCDRGAVHATGERDGAPSGTVNLRRRSPGHPVTNRSPIMSTAIVPINRALLSVFDKTGMEAFAKELARLGVDLVSTGGTSKLIAGTGAAVRDISDLTGFPEMMDGRVKTLHPKVHGGLLAVRDNPTHKASMDEHEIGAIDLVVVNLYPFEATIA